MLVDEPAPLDLERRPLLAHRRRLVVERLDLGLEPGALGLDLGDALPHGLERARRGARARARSRRASARAPRSRRGARPPPRRRAGGAPRCDGAPARPRGTPARPPPARARCASRSATILDELGLDARDLVVDGVDADGARACDASCSHAPRPRARRPRGSACSARRRSSAVPRNATSASASAVDAAARASAAASTSPSSASSRSRAAVRSSRPRCHPSARRSRSRSRARRRAAASERDSASASAVSDSCLLRHLRLLLQRLQLPPELRQHVGEPQQVLVEVRRACARRAPCDGDASRCRRLPRCTCGGPRAWRAAPPRAGPGRPRCAGPARCPSRASSSCTSSRRTTWPLMRYSDSPERKIVRATSISLIGTGILPAELSITSFTSAMPRAGRDGRAGEDHVGHLAAAERAGALLAEHPADRVDEVRLARAVGPHDDRDARDELEHRLVRERLEPADRDRPQEHVGGC